MREIPPNGIDSPNRESESPRLTMKAAALLVPAKPERRTGQPLPTVDQVMVEERAAAFTKRSIKTTAKLSGLKLAVSMMDLTTLEERTRRGRSPIFAARLSNHSSPAITCPPAARFAFIPAWSATRAGS